MRLDRPLLIAGHAALAMLALAAIHVTLPAAAQPQWHVADQSRPMIGQAARRLPASRRADREHGLQID